MTDDVSFLLCGCGKAILAVFILCLILFGVPLIIVSLPINNCVKIVATGATVFVLPMILSLASVFARSRRARVKKAKVLDLAVVASAIAITVLIVVLFATRLCGDLK